MLLWIRISKKKKHFLFFLFIPLSQRVEKVIGVEMNEQAIEDAKENAAINGTWYNINNI